MCFFFSLIPATIVTVIGFFVLFTSTKAEGSIRAFGRILAIWVFVIATFPLMGGAYATLTSACPLTEMVE